MKNDVSKKKKILTLDFILNRFVQRNHAQGMTPEMEKNATEDFHVRQYAVLRG